MIPVSRRIGLRRRPWPPSRTRATWRQRWAARQWLWPLPGPLPTGSEARARSAPPAGCSSTHSILSPSIIDWPELSDEALTRLTSLPIWDIAVQTEGKARLRMGAYARSLADPAWREAIGRNAWEENRHKEVLSNLVAAYGIGWRRSRTTASRAMRNGRIW